MKKGFLAVCALFMFMWSMDAHAEAEQVWDGHEIDVDIFAGMAFPTNIVEPRGFNVDDITYAFGLDTDLRIWWHLYGGFDFSYSHADGSSALITTSTDIFAFSFHTKVKYPLPWGRDRFRVGPAFGVGPYMVNVSASNGATDDDVAAGINMGLDMEYLISDLLFVGPTYRTHIILDDDDNFAVHTLGVQFGVRF